MDTGSKVVGHSVDRTLQERSAVGAGPGCKGGEALWEGALNTSCGKEGRRKGDRPEAPCGGLSWGQAQSRKEAIYPLKCLQKHNPRTPLYLPTCLSASIECLSVALTEEKHSLQHGGLASRGKPFHLEGK